MVVTTRMFHKMTEPTIHDMDRIDSELRTSLDGTNQDKIKIMSS